MNFLPTRPFLVKRKPPVVPVVPKSFSFAHRYPQGEGFR